MGTTIDDFLSRFSARNTGKLISSRNGVNYFEGKLQYSDACEREKGLHGQNNYHESHLMAEYFNFLIVFTFLIT